MAYQKFQEYLDANNKLKTSGTVTKLADYEGKVDTKPVKEKKHKDAGGKGQDGEVKPYKGGPDAKDPNKGKLSDGFAHKGDAKLKYTPKDVVGKTTEGVPGGKPAPTWPKTKTQEWVDKTKGMSLAEFTKTVREEAFKGLENKETPHNSIKETVNACKCNKKHVSSLVREMKRNGLFGKLVAEMMQHPETFKAFAILMERDESYARKFVKAMNEMIAPPMDGGGPPMMGKKKKPMMDLPHPDDMGDMEDDSDMDDDMGDMEDDDSLGDEEGDMGDDLDGDEGDMGDMDGDMDDEDGMDDDMGLGDDDLGIGAASPADAGMAPHDKMTPPKKKSKLHAHHHLLNAMKDHPAMMGGGM